VEECELVGERRQLFGSRPRIDRFLSSGRAVVVRNTSAERTAGRDTARWHQCSRLSVLVPSSTKYTSLRSGATARPKSVPEPGGVPVLSSSLLAT
jgi:hypothetical protein